MSIISIVICIELDVYIHRYILQAVKNVRTMRQSKMRVLIYSFLGIFICVLCFMFTPTPDLNKIEDNLLYNKKCKDRIFLIEDIIGNKESVNDVVYIWTITGAFWGIGLTIEKNVGIWWSAQGFSYCRKRKILASFIVGFLLLIPINLINIPNYEMNFVILCFAYFLYAYIMLGLLPVLFYHFGWNFTTGSTDKKDLRASFGSKNVDSQLLIPKTLEGANDPKTLGLIGEIDQIGEITGIID